MMNFMVSWSYIEVSQNGIFMVIYSGPYSDSMGYEWDFQPSLTLIYP